MSMKLQNKKHLPPIGVLQNRIRGGMGLLHVIYRYPKLFKDFVIDKNIDKVLQKHLSTMQKIADDNNGVVRSNKWIIENIKDGKTLCEYRRTHPQYFLHFKRERGIGGTMDLLEETKSMAKNNGGPLPSYSKLHSMGKGNIASFYKRHKDDVCSHIKQEWDGEKSIAECKKIIDLLKDENGIIPSPNKLQTSGYKSLDKRIREHEKEFSGIKQYYKGRVRTIGK